jgi:hypothetical protein
MLFDLRIDTDFRVDEGLVKYSTDSEGIGERLTVKLHWAGRSENNLLWSQKSAVPLTRHALGPPQQSVIALQLTS